MCVLFGIVFVGQVGEGLYMGWVCYLKLVFWIWLVEREE
jgi:hypothetical protein